MKNPKYISDWPEMQMWPSVWKQDFGFAPVGIHRIVQTETWYFNDLCLEGGFSDWGISDMHKLHSAQIAAAISRMLRIEGMTIQIRGFNIWIWKNIGEAEAKRQLFDQQKLLIRNLAYAAQYIIDNEWNRPAIVAYDGTSNLHMLLGKFDFQGTDVIL